jgi:hypothetical protein
MAENKPYAHRGDIMMVIPTGSVACSSGDYVVMARNIDPISRAVLGAESRIRPASSAYMSQWGIGIVDSDFTTNTVGATLYATPTANQALPVIRRGVVRLPINKTAGKTGDIVIYTSGATGAQLFTLNNYRRDVAVGRLYKDFTGATANDLQQVELIEKPISEKDIYFWLGNGVVQGCKFKMHSVANQRSTQIMAGATNDDNIFMVKGKQQAMARLTDFTIGVAAGAASAIRFFWLALKVSTTGAGVRWTKETCTAAFAGLASWTVSGISIGMMVPITWTSNMIPVAVGFRFSATLISMSGEKLLNLGNNGMIPWGSKYVDQTKWYL